MMSDTFRVDIEGAEIAIFPSAEKHFGCFGMAPIFLPLSFPAQWH